jgi:hypothetical protein
LPGFAGSRHEAPGRSSSRECRIENHSALLWTGLSAHGGGDANGAGGSRAGGEPHATHRIEEFTVQDEWTPPDLDSHYRILLSLGWGLFSAMAGSAIRALGHEPVEALFERILRTHQQHYFLEGVRILGLENEASDAIIAAKYHYLSNMVGGIRLGYAEESLDKAWCFYLTPDPLFDYGVGLSVLRPEFWLANIKGWHVFNGESLGNPGLRVVVTHAKAHGDPYDAVYFLDTHRMLSPEERLVVNWGETPPPIRVGDLEGDAWPLGRRVNGLRNYHVGYIGAMIYHLDQLFGTETMVEVVRHAYAILLYQKQDLLYDGLEVPRDHPFATALMLRRMLKCFGEDAS